MIPRLKKSERQDRILTELRVSPTVRISTLAQEFLVSTETIRRDIDEMSDKGLLERTYGGAAVRSLVFEPGVRERGLMNEKEREMVGKLSAQLIFPGEVIMVDAGTTTTHFAKALSLVAKDLTVITNSLGALSAFSHVPGTRVLMCPGDYHERENGVFGPETLTFLRRYSANKAIISAGGLTREGPSDVDSHAVWVKRAMLERSDRGVLLMDHGKFDLGLLEVVCPLDDLDDVVVDTPPEKQLSNALRNSGVTLHVAECDLASSSA